MTENKQPPIEDDGKDIVKKWLFKQPEFTTVDWTTDKSIFYHVAPQKFIDLIHRYHSQPQADRGSDAEAAAEEIENLLYNISTSNGKRAFTPELCSELTSEIFKLIAGAKWANTQPIKEDTPADDGWVSEKPKIKEDCIMLVATYWKDHWETNAFDIIAQDEENDEGEPCWYWSVLDHGDEWGDFDDIHGQLYKIINLPKPPNEQKDKRSVATEAAILTDDDKTKNKVKEDTPIAINPNDICPGTTGIIGKKVKSKNHE